MISPKGHERRAPQYKALIAESKAWRLLADELCGERRESPWLCRQTMLLRFDGAISRQMEAQMDERIRNMLDDGCVMAYTHRDDMTDAERCDARVLAALLFAEICEDEASLLRGSAKSDTSKGKKKNGA